MPVKLPTFLSPSDYLSNPYHIAIYLPTYLPILPLSISIYLCTFLLICLSIKPAHLPTCQPVLYFIPIYQNLISTCLPTFLLTHLYLISIYLPPYLSLPYFICIYLPPYLRNRPPIYTHSYLEPRDVELRAARLALQLGHVPRRLDYEPVERLDELRGRAGKLVLVQHLAVRVEGLCGVKGGVRGREGERGRKV